MSNLTPSQVKAPKQRSHALSIAIVDDSKTERDKFNEYLNSYIGTSLAKIEVFYYHSGEHFFEEAQINQLNVVFIDIYMNGMTGLEVATKIRQINEKCQIVLISVSKDFIHDSYDLKALYYMIKPYSYERFETVMRLVDENIYLSPFNIQIKANREYVTVNIGDIVFVDLYKHYVQFHLTTEMIKTYVLTFNDVQHTLLKHPSFINCYRCIIVNMDHVSKIDGKDFVMSNGVRVPINRQRFNEIKDAYARYMFDHVYKER